MFAFLRNWIISVVATVIFMVLVDMIMPSNSLKKYTKLVTGLIVIITIITPIFKLLDKNNNIESLISQYTEKYNDVAVSNKIDTQNNFTEETIKVYKQNLIKGIEADILYDTGKKYEVVDMEVVEDVNSPEFTNIKNIELKRKLDGNIVKPVEKIVIGKVNNNKGYFWDEKVAGVLKNRYMIKPSIIKFIK